MNLLPALSSSRLRRALRQTRIVALAIVVTLVAAQANAGIVIPNAPLQANGGVPANVWFILDDSGSMAATNLPDNVPATAPVNISAQAYTRNTIHYNPEITYRPWRQWNGTFMPDATYLSASNDPINLSSPTNLGTVVRTFYAPVTGITDLSDARQYVRYQILVGGLTATACGWTNLPAGFNNCAVVSSFTWASGTRTLDQEKANYANWYQYHRTRTKVAKAGASDAFNQIGTDIRVGFTTIWDRNTFLIPVGVDGGLFDNIGPNTNRSTWFDRLFNATANGTTPLKASLNRAGQYFSRTDGGGPYGPEALESQQIPCRQNFSILVTDGYANENAFPTANEDGTAGPTITGPGGQSFTYTPALP